MFFFFSMYDCSKTLKEIRDIDDSKFKDGEKSRNERITEIITRYRDHVKTH